MRENMDEPHVIHDQLWNRVWRPKQITQALGPKGIPSWYELGNPREKIFKSFEFY